LGHGKKHRELRKGRERGRKEADITIVKHIPCSKTLKTKEKNTEIGYKNLHL